MRKLYKTIKGRIAYWEAWQTKSKILVHTGWLGHWGKQVKEPLLAGESEIKAIARLAADPISDGYRSIEDDEHVRLVIQKSLDTWGTAEDLDTREAIYAVANEWLGWTGNGRAQGGDIGSGTVNVFCLVIDPVRAVKTLVTELRKSKQLADVTIAYATARGMKIGFPAGTRKRFSLLGKPKAKTKAKAKAKAKAKRKKKR